MANNFSSCFRNGCASRLATDKPTVDFLTTLKILITYFGCLWCLPTDFLSGPLEEPFVLHNFEGFTDSTKGAHRTLVWLYNLRSEGRLVAGWDVLSVVCFVVLLSSFISSLQ